MREKLIELLETLFCSATALDLADYLIANGVTTADDRPRFFIKRNHMGQEELEQIIGSGPVILSVGEDSIIPIHPGRWFPVTERLPEKDGKYLLFTKGAYGTGIRLLSFAKDGRKVDRYDFHREWKNVWYYYDSEWGHITVDTVTHWMPLPEPPKGESK